MLMKEILITPTTTTIIITNDEMYFKGSIDKSLWR
jgi:hypothetical protein